MNRALLSDIIGSEYNVIEAENGLEAIAALQKHTTNISLVLLDIVMPEMDGFDVLAVMNKRNWIRDIPVIMVSSESASSYVVRAYELGVTDFISRPFDANIVQKRVSNTLMLYSKQKALVGMVADQIYDKEKNSNMMVAILSHIVEFRNGESGLHVLHVGTLTELLLKRLAQKERKYNLSSDDISLISMASSLHDIGKISIPEEVLNKPGKLTDEEFEMMKQHTIIGAKMLEDLPLHQDEDLVKVAYEICRWHHERYDGRGYPDGLKGEDIPISAQVVAMADVYDALTSERVYKPAYSHEKALDMILNGECGTFNPLLLECLTDIAEEAQHELQVTSFSDKTEHEIQKIADAVNQTSEITASGRTVELLEYERMKYQFFASMSNEVQYEFRVDPPMMSISEWGAKELGLPVFTMNPMEDPHFIEVLGRDNMRHLSTHLRTTTPAEPVYQFDTQVHVDGNPRWVHIVARAIWSDDEEPQYLGSIGKFVDIHETHEHMMTLQHEASHDSLTGILNHASARSMIIDRMDRNPKRDFALIIVDLDFFKTINDTYGHQYGDVVLKELAARLDHSVRENDIVARVGGDEFLVFVQCTKNELEGLANRIFRTACGTREDTDHPLQVSMGIALTSDIGRDYDELFHCADSALYAVKQSGRGSYTICTPGSGCDSFLTEVSPIDYACCDDESVQEASLETV